MASIRNSISLTDRMTPTLRSILKAMDSTLRVMKQLDKASNNGAQSKAYKRAEKDLKMANNQLIKMGNYNKMVARSAGDGERAYRRMGSAVSGAVNNMRSLTATSSMFLQSLASGVYLAQKLANAVGGVMNTADTSRSQVARLGLYNTSQYSNEALYGQVFRTALDTRSGLTETADLVNKILISGVYSGESAVQAAIGTAGIINRALVAGGGTAEENERAIRQLTQGLASGILQGDELRSIREQAPYFAEVLARGLSQVDERFEGIGIGDRKRLGAEGELTADRVVKAMWAMQDEINEDFESMPKTFGQAMTSMSNIWQYFLWMLSDAEGPLGRINDKLWKFVDYLQTPQGFEFLNAVAQGIDILSWAITSVMDGIGRFVTFLQENSKVAQAIFIALGTAAAVSGMISAAAWIAATWPILLLITLVGVLVYMFLDAGYTAQEVIGAITGGFMFALAVVWDLLMGTGQLILWVLQIASYVGWTILMILYGVLAAFTTVIHAIIAAFYTGLELITLKVYDFYSDVAGVILNIAKLIDEVFGTGLYDAAASVDAEISGWFEGRIQEFGDKRQENTEEIKDLWNKVFDTAGAGYSWITDAGAEGRDYLEGLYVDPTEAYATGNEWVAGVMEGLGDFNLGLPDNSVLDMFNANGLDNGVTVDGGYLDGIKSDVDISDEDVQLMRDMAARDFLLQLQAITPVANVTFGDVRETADVNKIVEVIEQMVDEQMATALVS